MRTLNVKAAVILLIVVIFVAVSTALLHNYQVLRRSSTLKDLAIAAWNETPRRDVDAVQGMRAYLVLRPNDYDAIQKLGGWLIEVKRFSLAANTLEELMRGLEKQEPPDTKMIAEVHRQLAGLCMENLGNWPAAEHHLAALLQNCPADHPEQLDTEGAMLLLRLGDCYRHQGKVDKAIDCYRKAKVNDKNKCHVDIYYHLARVLQYDKQDIKAAQECMAEMIAVKQNAESPHARQAYAMWLEELGDYKQALEQAKIALKLKKDFPSALYHAGNCELSLRHFPKAEEYAQQGLKVAPQDAEMYILTANVAVGYDHLDKAIDVLRQGVKTVKSNAAKAELLWHLANFLLDGSGGPGNAAGVAEAEKCIRQMSEYRFSPVQLDYLKARVLYAKEDWGAALNAFYAVRPKLAEFPPEMKVLYDCTGQCYRQQGNPDQADYAFHLALKIDPFDFKAHDGIAQIYIDKGLLKDAVGEYHAVAYEVPSNVDAQVAYAGAMLLWTLSQKEDERNWRLLDQELDRAKLLVPSDARIDNLMMEADLDRGRLDEVKRWVENAGKVMPNSVAVYVAAADLDARHGDFAKASDELDKARAKLGDVCLLRLARASLALRDPVDRAAAEIDTLAENLDRFSTDEKIQLLTGLFGDLMAIKEFDRAKAIGRRLSELKPHDAMIRYRLLELDLATHNYREPEASLADIDRLLREIEAAAGRGPIWCYGKAVRLRLEAAQGKPELYQEAMHYAEEAQRRRLNWSRPDVLMGEICRAQGEDDKALEHYLQASVNGDRDPEFNRLLLQMLLQRQRYQEAEQVINRLENNRVTVPHDVAEIIAEIYALGGDFDRAYQSANKGYNEASDDYGEHLWHGKILRILARRARLEGHPDKLPQIVAGAEKSFRRAIEIAPTAADCRVELVLLLVFADQKAKALKAAEEAELMIPSDVAPLALGYIYDALGKTEKAAASYEKALAQHPDNTRVVRTLAEFYLRNRDPQHAAPLVEKLLSGQLAVSEADRTIARRLKAELLFGRGHPHYKEALALIEQNLVPPPGPAADRRIKARILLADPATARNRETLALLEGLVKPFDASPEPQDRFELARYYLRRNQWDRCREQMETLVNSERSETQYLGLYVKMLLDQGQLPDAESRLQQLENGKQFSAAALHAELMFRRNLWHGVTEYLTTYLDAPGVRPEKRSDRLLLVAQLYEDFGTRLTKPTERATARGFFDQTEKLLEENAKTGPSGEMTLAAFYARRGRLDEAIRRLQDYSVKADPKELSIAALAVIGSEKVTALQLQKLETVLTSVAAGKRPTLLLTALGLLKITQGQPVEAEEYYRQVLARDPTNFRAYNNLAVLLALSGKNPDEALARKNLDEALSLVNRAIELAGSQPGLLDSRAVVRIARGDYQQALDDLEVILKDPAETANRDYPVWLFHKARALFASKHEAEAGDVLHTAIHKHDLKREQIDLPEHGEFDKLENEMKKM